MSDGSARAAPRTAPQPEELARIPLLAGVPEAELAELAWALRYRDLPAGEVLWRQGEEAESMAFVTEGTVELSLSLPGRRTAQVVTTRAGEVLGELALIDGGPRSLTATAVERTRVLTLSRADFTALVSRRHPTSFLLKRRLAGIACAHIRRHHAEFAAALDGEPGDG